ncbi:HIT domain-containing protein [Candidatus Pacearchaeota archaeon]|nr:HIT domain-containing protein [Candidatus Pacearchaeota archaeon]
MALTPEQIKELKGQLLKQIQHLPQDQKREFEHKIDEMSPEALELMLNQQKQGKQDKTIFRMIVDKDVPSTIIEENGQALAVLDINPISQGHTLIIPKNHAKKPEDISSPVFTLAKKLAKKISLELKPKSVDILPETKFGETVINLLPIYNVQVSLQSERKKSSTEELEKIAQKLRARKKKDKAEVIKIRKITSTENPVVKLPRRIP